MLDNLCDFWEFGLRSHIYTASTLNLWAIYLSLSPEFLHRFWEEISGLLACITNILLNQLCPSPWFIYLSTAILTFNRMFYSNTVYIFSNYLYFPSITFHIVLFDPNKQFSMSLVFHVPINEKVEEGSILYLSSLCPSRCEFFWLKGKSGI